MPDVLKSSAETAERKIFFLLFWTYTACFYDELLTAAVEILGTFFASPDHVLYWDSDLKLDGFEFG